MVQNRYTCNAIHAQLLRFRSHRNESKTQCVSVCVCVWICVKWNKAFNILSARFHFIYCEYNVLFHFRLYSSWCALLSLSNITPPHRSLAVYNKIEKYERDTCIMYSCTKNGCYYYFYWLWYRCRRGCGSGSYVVVVVSFSSVRAVDCWLTGLRLVAHNNTAIFAQNPTENFSPSHSYFLIHKFRFELENCENI